MIKEKNFIFNIAEELKAVKNLRIRNQRISCKKSKNVSVRGSKNIERLKDRAVYKLVGLEFQRIKDSRKLCRL